MAHKVILTKSAPQPSPNYSQAIAVDLGTHIYLTMAGQTGNEPVSDEVVQGGIEAQTTQALENIKAVIEAVSGVYGRVEDIVETTIYLENMEQDKAGFEKAYKGFFERYLTNNKSYRPARDLVEVSHIPLISETTIVEIKARAMIPKKR